MTSELNDDDLVDYEEVFRFSYLIVLRTSDAITLVVFPLSLAVP